MKLPSALLACLIEAQAREESCSGEELGEHLGISRAAIWKQVSSLKQLGLEIEAVPGAGYRLQSAVELLDAEALVERYQDRVSVCYEPLMDSTNDALRRYHQQQSDGFARPCLATTEFQDAGRGRRGRAWQAGFAGSLLLSLGVRLPCAAAQLGGLSLACGVAVVDALRAEGAQQASLKWPNDVLLDGRKLGGILIEVLGEADGPCDVIVGVGLNLKAASHLEDAVDQPWAALDEVIAVSRNALLQGVIDRLLQVLQEYGVSGFEPWRDRWQGYHAFADQEVSVLQGKQTHVGLCRGVDSQGALLVEMDGQLRTFFSAEVSLRRYEATD